MEENQYRELTAEELNILKPLFEEGTPLPFVRVGPKGYIFTKEHCHKYASEFYNLELRDGDVFVASYQRSGTTVTQELVWLLVNNFDYDKAAAVPLSQRYAFLEMASLFTEDFIEHDKKMHGKDNTQRTAILGHMATPAIRLLADVPSPRFVKTHLPMSMLPHKLLDTAKVVYIARDPRDVAVSCYHQAKLFNMLYFKGTFKDMWNAFRNDLYVLTPYFEHVKESWALRNHPNMLFLFYEELLKDLPSAVARVSEFLGKEVSSEQMERLCNHLNINNFRKNKSVNYEELRGAGLLDSQETFIRKGKVGGWREYFDEEMTRDAERWIAHNLTDTDLVFPTMN